MNRIGIKEWICLACLISSLLLGKTEYIFMFGVLGMLISIQNRLRRIEEMIRWKNYGRD